jgi:hypothetical protein
MAVRGESVLEHESVDSMGVEQEGDGLAFIWRTEEIPSTGTYDHGAARRTDGRIRWIPQQLGNAGPEGPEALRVGPLGLGPEREGNPGCIGHVGALHFTHAIITSAGSPCCILPADFIK